LPAEHDEIMIRRLNDGREFRIVKNFHEPERLIELAGAAGFALDLHHTDTYFQFGEGIAI
jgi:adenylate kinase